MIVKGISHTYTVYVKEFRAEKTHYMYQQCVLIQSWVRCLFPCLFGFFCVVVVVLVVVVDFSPVTSVC